MSALPARSAAGEIDSEVMAANARQNCSVTPTASSAAFKKTPERKFLIKVNCYRG
jgi:hypothetical protein